MSTDESRPEALVEASLEASTEASPEARRPAMPSRHTRESPRQSHRTPEATKARLRKGSALPSSSRSSSAELRYSLARHLTERDRQIIDLIGRHRVLTTDQIARLFFDTRRRAQLRLVALYRLGVLNRFPVYSPVGSAPYHYVLGQFGVEVFAAARGEEATRTTIRRRADRTVALAATQRFEHLMGVNEFYVRLACSARRERDASLRWLTEGETAVCTDGVVRPDGSARWRADGRCVDLFLEFDRGTEPLGRLAAKLAAYERFESESGWSPWVLFCFVSSRREKFAAQALGGASLPVATAVLGDASPAETVWLPLTDAAVGRVALSSLADIPRPHASLRRTSTGGARAWRFDRSIFDEEAPIEPR